MTHPNVPAGWITTSQGAAREREGRARELASACGLELVRPSEAPEDAVVVLEHAGARLHSGGRVVRSHPGMGLVRLRRLLKGRERDPLLDLSGLTTGQSVLDATFGFGQDALVLAHAVGAAGRVEALESSPLLAALALGGMGSWPAPAAVIAGRIALRRADFREVLPALPAASFDVVYFDPMFRRARSAAPDFAILRDVANRELLRPEDLLQARRVARRLVLVKDAWPGLDLRRLGVEPLGSRRSAEIVYGRVPSL